MDKRKNNGGNSTKSKKGFDKRKNEYRQALSQAATVDDVVSVIKSVKAKAINKQDIQAAKLFLEYYLGKPDQSLDIKSDGETISFKELVNFGNTKS
jgi:hypothetical protein